MMDLDIISFEMNNLVYDEVKTIPDNFLHLLGQSEELIFEDGYYKNGPTIIEVKPTEFEEDEQTYKFYIPVNEPVSNGQSKLIDTINLEQVFRTRMPFGEDIEGTLNEMKTTLQQNNLQYEDKLFMVMNVVYHEYWVDLLIPILK